MADTRTILNDFIDRTKKFMGTHAYTKFINPILNLMDKDYAERINREVKFKVESILTSSKDAFKYKLETIQDEEYIKITDVEEILNREKNNYLI